MKRNRTRSIIFVGLILARAAIFAGVNVTNIGPKGGTFRSLGVDPQDSRTLYAGARTAGVFKSIDGGATWTYAGRSGFTVASLAVDPQDSNTIYVATVFENADDFRSFGLFKSQDGGENWSAVNSGLPAECLSTFAPTIDPQYPSTLYALTSCAGVFKSANGGENWYAVNSGLPDREPGTAAGATAASAAGG
jgi:photosystem II stability/assembly factor-like uncharacterized protein